MTRGNCREELRPRNFLLGYEIPGHFASFQCGFPRAYLAWRVFWALYHTTWIIVSGFMSYQWAGPDSSQYIKWFIYLTDWSYFMLTLSDVIAAVVVVYIYIKRKDFLQCEGAPMSWYLKAVWVVFNVANSASVATGLLYWGLLYSPKIVVTAVDAETHAVNVLYVIVNLFLTGTPVRLYHFFHPLIYGVVYWLFSVFYYLAGGTNVRHQPYIYSVLDWRDPNTAAMYIGLTVFVALPVCHVILYLFFLLRRFLYKVCCSQSALGEIV